MRHEDRIWSLRYHNNADVAAGSAILRRKGKSEGSLYYPHLFRLRFYRDIVLISRCADRVQGHVEELDAVMGTSFHLSEDAIKKVRLAIARRLQQPSTRP